MNSITACPNVLQYCPVLCNIRPVTVTAEVAVYNASIKGVISEFALEIAKGHHKYFTTDNKPNEEKLNFYKSEAVASMQRQKDIESSDTLSLDDYLLKY